MNEHREMTIKSALMNFIKAHFVFEGNPVMIEEKVFTLTNKLYRMFQLYAGEDAGDDDTDEHWGAFRVKIPQQ